MPTYVYRCAKCGEQLEAFQSFADAPLTKHDECGGKLSKVLSAPAIALKGSGFYKTDNRSSNGKPREKTKEAASSGSDSSSGSGSSSDSGSSGSGSGSSDSGSSGKGDSKPKTDSTSTRASGGSEAKSA